MSVREITAPSRRSAILLGGSEPHSYPHQCPQYPVTGATARQCSIIAYDQHKNLRNCCAVNCNASQRPCFECVGEGLKPGDERRPINEFGLCAEHAARLFTRPRAVRSFGPASDEAPGIYLPPLPPIAEPGSRAISAIGGSMAGSAQARNAQPTNDPRTTYDDTVANDTVDQDLALTGDTADDPVDQQVDLVDDTTGSTPASGAPAPYASSGNVRRPRVRGPRSARGVDRRLHLREKLAQLLHEKTDSGAKLAKEGATRRWHNTLSRLPNEPGHWREIGRRYHEASENITRRPPLREVTRIVIEMLDAGLKGTAVAERFGIVSTDSQTWTTYHVKLDSTFTPRIWEVVQRCDPPLSYAAAYLLARILEESPEERREALAIELVSKI